MYCRNCGDRLPTGVEVCPGCGARTGMGKKRKSISSRVWFWILLIAIVPISFSIFSFAAVGSYTASREQTEVSDWENAQEWDDVEWDYEDDDHFVSRSDVTVKEMVIYDDNGISVTTKGYDDTGYSKQIKLLVENQSGRDVTLFCNTFVINGITVHDSMFIDVKNGKKTNDYIDLYKDTLEWNGIADVATLSTFNAEILDPDSYDKLDDFGFRIETSLTGSYEQPIDDSGVLLYDRDGIMVTYQKMVTDSIGTAFKLLMKNDSGRDLLIQAEDVSVNDFMVTPCMSDASCDGTVSYCELLIFDEYMEENGIKDVQTLSFQLKFLDPVSYDTVSRTGELQVQFGE